LLRLALINSKEGMVSAGLDKFFVIIGINRMIGKGLVMAVPGLDPGVVPAIHAAD
jgi:hypothetical protein